MPDGNVNAARHGASRYQNTKGDAYDRRDGFGTEIWKKQEQKYEGSFDRDAFHGEGAYRWSITSGKEGFVFEGDFYSNFKEGYGLVSLPDGSVFEGLFSNNRPLGPGVKTYPNGHQDVGFWSGNRLVRLCSSIDCIIPRLAGTRAGKLKLLKFQTIAPFVEKEKDADIGAALLIKHGLPPSQSPRLYADLVHDPRSMFFDRPHLGSSYFVLSLKSADSDSEASEKKNLPSGFEPPHSRSASPTKGDKMSYGVPEVSAATPDRELFPVCNAETEDGGVIRLLSWNRSELCVEMLKHIFRFRSSEEKLTFKISDLMAGDRTKFRKSGEMERLNLRFLDACSTGPAHAVKQLLCSKNISEELMDAGGNNGVMFAAATDQHEIIELLLNYGADVNAFNDENLTPLNFCLLRRAAEASSLSDSVRIFFHEPEPFPFVVGQVKSWQTAESTQSLDRTYRDEISTRDNRKPICQTGEVSQDESVFFFDDSSEDDEDLSGLAFLTRKVNEMPKDDVSERSSRRAADYWTGAEKAGKGVHAMSLKREEHRRSLTEPEERDKYYFKTNEKKSDKGGASEEAPDPGAAAASGAPNVRSHVLRESPQNNFTTSSYRIASIDRTIELLIRRGADPNLGDEPKPSLHLAVYSGDPNLVRLLLTYGASPHSRTLPQDGLLMPLHVLVLMKPGQELLAMCELLLKYGANPEEETSPTFSPNGDNDLLLDPEHGRTPLQLLCTRRDAEATDTEGFLARLALLLVRVSAAGHFFRGHSYLTLALISGNYAIAEALLSSKKTDPNEVLGGDLGTALHVLVSTEFQKRTLFENSIRMCDLLMKHGANPNLKFRTSAPSLGTCVDYGYEEIEKESNREQKIGFVTIEPEKRCHLEDHLRVVEYLEKKARLVELTDRKHCFTQGQTGRSRIEGKEKRNRGSRSVKANCGDDANGKGITRKSRNKNEENHKNWEHSRRNEGCKVSERSAPEETQVGKQILKVKKHPEKGGAAKGATEKKSKKKVKRTGKLGRTNDHFGVRVRMGSAEGENIKRTHASDTEKFPERFRRSLLHMFGISGEKIDLNDFVLPYVVLRNGDLYYRFQGRKPAGTEQYSLI